MMDVVVIKIKSQSAPERKPVLKETDGLQPDEFIIMGDDELNAQSFVTSKGGYNEGENDHEMKQNDDQKEQKQNGYIMPPAPKNKMKKGLLKANKIKEKQKKINYETIDIYKLMKICDECGKSVHAKSGKVDKDDGHWYCNTCWESYD